MTETITAHKTQSLQIFTMENHDKAYYIWKEANVKEKILIHIDAHHDIWFIPKDSQITIANFICKALEESIVKEVYWVVPDKTWDSKKTKKQVLKHLKRISRRYPGGPTPIRIEKNQISTQIIGRPLKVCTLDSLPEIKENVLLDIDVDYLVIPYVSYGKTDKHGELPWCWPQELIGKLNSKKIKSNLITIAYSVEGGYTPLEWKYLGDELALRLQNENDQHDQIKGIELIKEGAIAACSNNFALAEKKYLEAQELLPTIAVPAVPEYHLALLYSKQEKDDKAQKFYKQAIAKDPSYVTPYNSKAINYFKDKLFKEAENEHHKVLKIDPNNAYALLGLGLIEFKRKKLNEAKALLKKSLKENEYLVDAYYTLGDIFFRERKYEEAKIAYEEALKLTLSGHKSLKALLLTCTSENLLTDPMHYQLHAKLAKLCSISGNTEEAINGYRISIQGGNDTSSLRLNLALLYMKKRKVKKAITEAWQALIKFPLGLWEIIHDFINYIELIIEYKLRNSKIQP